MPARPPSHDASLFVHQPHGDNRTNPTITITSYYIRFGTTTVEAPAASHPSGGCETDCGSTVRLFNCSTVQLFNGSTVQRFNGSCKQLPYFLASHRLTVPIPPHVLLPPPSMTAAFRTSSHSLSRTPIFHTSGGNCRAQACATKNPNYLLFLSTS